ncbi:hypothetical protein BCU90_19565 [Vibrio lentus]|uniref:hypothetical protein n=1 Tax=Vibrio lentus TaxID=136468 RepID=UPI000C84CB3D|nr:hypothetical protein [Vibrio lentus]PMG45180.1 hypothetical protein BCU90_19565 [Vibrio lentus]
MKRLLLILASTFPFHSSANDTLVESIERFTDIFGISFSKVDNSTVATLDANYRITDDFRVFGDIDTDLNWEVGVGYSFWQGSTYYTENTFKASENKLTTGIFAAKLLHEDWTLIGDINYNYKFEQEQCYDFRNLTCTPSDSIEYSAGLMWSPIKYADLLLKYNQEIGVKNNEYYLDIPATGNRISQSDKTNLQYYELVTFINIKYLKPSITYSYFPENTDNNYVEFGLAFDF